MSAFKHRPGDFAITVSNGVYKQVDVFERLGELYVKEGSGFVQLRVDGSTTKPRVNLDTLSMEAPLASSATGRLILKGTGGDKERALPAARLEKLGLGAPDNDTPKLED